MSGFVELIESIYNTDVLKDFEKQYKGRIPEKEFTKEEEKQIQAWANIPSLLPYDVDRTYEAWFLRISVWGKIKLTHKNPDVKITRSLTIQEFIAYIHNADRNEAYGQWDVEEYQLGKIRFSRTFMGLNGRNVTEELLVDIDLRPDVKQAIAMQKTNKSLFGKFKKLLFNK